MSKNRKKRKQTPRPEPADSPDSIRQNQTGESLTGQQEEAAVLLAEDVLTDEEIADKVGISRAQLALWKKIPEFAARIESHVEALGKVALRYAVARVNRRVSILDDARRRLEQVVAERGADPDMRDVPGGRTGILVHTVKGVGKGEDFQLIDLYEVDTALLKELRDTMKQAAQELGQWTEKKDVTSGGKPFKVYQGIDVERV